MNKKDLEKLPRKNLLPGFESGRYEPARQYDRSEFRSLPMDDLERRDNRVSIRISGSDLNKLRSVALAEGLPVQSLLAGIIHRYVSENLSGAAAGLDESLLAATSASAVASASPAPSDESVQPVLPRTGRAHDLPVAEEP